MSTFQLNVKEIAEAQAEIKYIILNLNDVQQRLEIQISRLDICFNCGSSYEVKNRLNSVSANQIGRISDNLSGLLYTLDDISESVRNFEQKAASSDADIDKFLDFIKNMMPWLKDSLNTGKDILSTVLSIMGSVADGMEEVNKNFKFKFDADTINFFKDFGDIGGKISVGESIIEVVVGAYDDFTRLNSDGEMSNRDWVKLGGDAFITVGGEVLGNVISDSTAVIVTAAVAGCSGGIFAPYAPFVGAVCATAVSHIYDDVIKEPLVNTGKFVYEKAVDFVGDNKLIEKYVDYKVNEFDKMANDANTLINDFGDNVQGVISDMGHATFGDQFDNVDKFVDNVQEGATFVVNKANEGFHKMGNWVKGKTISIFS